MRRIVLLWLLVLVTVAVGSTFAAAAVKNVILFVGDGMGMASIDLARTVLAGSDGYLDFERAEYTGIQKTHSADSLVTDSAAAATALATGFKTNNAWLSITPDGRSVKTLVEAAREAGKATGLVTTVTITHATPAAFGAHTTSRDELPVADQYAALKTADVYMGGGLAFFVPRSAPGSKRSDERNLVREFQEAGYSYVSSRAQLLSASAPTGKLLGLFAQGHLPYYIDRPFLGVDVPTLAEMTQKALDILSRDPEGFFLMVEAGKPDWANHGHDAMTATMEIYELNEAVNAALNFLEVDPSTLIVVTADHETGGVGLSVGKYFIKPEVLKRQRVSAEVLAGLVKGKGDQEVAQVMAEFAGISDLTPEELARVKTASARAIAEVIAQRAQIGWTTTSHTGESVPVYAFGRASYLFAGVYDNTDVARKIASAAGLELSR